MPTETSLDSFVLRFVRESETNADPSRPRRWYGIIRHAQSNRERHFTRWDDALSFISEYVDLREEKTDAPA
jgi:hypothetical protein